MHCYVNVHYNSTFERFHYAAAEAVIITHAGSHGHKVWDRFFSYKKGAVEKQVKWIFWSTGVRRAGAL